MTTQPNQGITFAAPAAFEIHRRPCCPVDVATHTVAVFRAGGGADPETTCRPSRMNAAASPIGGMITGIKRSKHRRDIGALKRELIEIWIAERNAFAETAVKDMRSR